MRSKLSCMAALAVVLVVGHASAADYGVPTRPGLVYAEHDGIKLIGDLYLPRGRAKAPVLVAIVTASLTDFRAATEMAAQGHGPSERS
jgi:hypothetical protein